MKRILKTFESFKDQPDSIGEFMKLLKDRAINNIGIVEQVNEEPRLDLTAFLQIIEDDIRKQYKIVDFREAEGNEIKAELRDIANKIRNNNEEPENI